MSDAGPIELLIESRGKDIGDLEVRRALPDRQRQRIGPFIFFDHMGPAEYPPDSGINVRSHPHIGLATITWLFEGEMLHRDSLGFIQEIRPGAVNWMTAGKGIVHAEKVTPEVRARGQKLHGIQTWVALPTEREEIEPRFEHYPADQIPGRTDAGVELIVIIGNAYGLESPVETESTMFYVEANLASAATLQPPDAQEVGIYVVDGSVDVGGEVLQSGQLAVLAPGAVPTMTAGSDCKLMLLGGDTLDGERHIWWNFVSSSRERLEAAKVAWHDGAFDAVPGEEDSIPLPSI